MANDCIFCAIANGEMGELVYEDELVAAFNDVNPAAPVHVLIVPKAHVDHLSSEVPAATLQAMFAAADAIAKATGVDQTGYRLITNIGKDAGQTVMHAHIHLLGGTHLGAGLLPEA
jgi:histidine triad (HIT) family protein